MDAIFFNKKFEQVYLLDTYESFIWTDRYNKCGDFEIYAAALTEYFDNIKEGYYVYIKDSDYTMIVEDFEIISDIEEGVKLKITGRSLESILDRRIVWNQTIISGNLQNGIKTLLDEAIISPSDENRKIPNFIFQESEDEAITSLTIESAQYTGDLLYDVITKLCQQYRIGFKITLNDSNEFVFSLFAGVDRSYLQESNPYVIFSPKFENIVNSNYLESKKTEKTITLVAGEGEGNKRKTVVVDANPEDIPTGIERREIYTDARDISKTTENKTLTDAEYNEQLKQRGKEKLSEFVYLKKFDGEVETLNSFRYGVDFFMGDFVQLVNDFGTESKARVVEMIHSQDINGYSEYPTFENLE